MTLPRSGSRTGPAPQDAAVPRERRRQAHGRAALAAVALAVAVVLVAWLVMTGGGDRAPAPDAAAVTSSAAAEETAPAEETPPAQPAPVGSTDELPAALPEVPLDAPAAVGNGIVATVAALEATEGRATRPGEVSGPALRVTVRIENGSSEPVSLDAVTVNVGYGPGDTPASPIDAGSGRPFSGMVEADGAAEGTYVFSVPADARDSVTVEVGYQPGAPRLLFVGAAS